MWEDRTHERLKLPLLHMEQGQEASGELLCTLPGICPRICIMDGKEAEGGTSGKTGGWGGVLEAISTYVLR